MADGRPRARRLQRYPPQRLAGAGPRDRVRQAGCGVEVASDRCREVCPYPCQKQSAEFVTGFFKRDVSRLYQPGAAARNDPAETAGRVSECSTNKDELVSV